MRKTKRKKYFSYIANLIIFTIIIYYENINTSGVTCPWIFSYAIPVLYIHIYELWNLTKIFLYKKEVVQIFQHANHGETERKEID